jgi:hypothetical protein
MEPNLIFESTLEDLEFEKNVPKLKPKYLQIGKTRLKLTSKEPFVFNVKTETRGSFQKEELHNIDFDPIKKHHFFYYKFFSKFEPKKYDVNLYQKKKKKSLKKKARICQISKKEHSKSSIFYNKLQ